MAIAMHNISGKGKKSKKRVGRGLGSGSGTTAGRGQKGQKARSGSGGFQRLGIRKLMLATPKLRGFNSLYPSAPVVNVGDLSRKFGSGEVVSPKTLAEKGLIESAKHGAKILGNGELKLALTVKECAVSKSAAEKIIAAGGSISA